MTGTRIATRGREPSEAAIQASVIAHWRAFGVHGSLVAAIPNARAHGQAGLTRGLYDLICIAPKFGVGFLELKTSRGRESEHQVNFGAILTNANVPHAVTYGRDEPIALLERWGIVRKRA
jgi:hypothetical protein